MDRYTILYRSQNRQAIGRGAQKLGGRAAAADASVRLMTADLDEAEAAEASAAPEVELVTRAMRTKLIRPFDANGAEDKAPWGLDAVGATASAFTGAGVKVAVLDTGIEPSHPAFKGVSINEKDFTGSGSGDRHGHGTHCAGTIFGRDVNGVRIGVAGGVKDVLIGKVLADDGSGDSAMIFQALNWCLQQKAHVISMSLGFDFPGEVADKVSQGWPVDLATSEALHAFQQNLLMFRAVVEQAAHAGPFGVRPLIVAAAGNESKRQIHKDYRISASVPAVVCDLAVAALGESKGQFSVAEFSNSNPDLAAPGVDITSAAPGGGLTTMSGTSMACPHVAGVAALWAEKVRQAGDRIDGATIRSHLIANAKVDKIPNYKAGAYVDVGRGLVQAP